jgi:thiol:disulfide interchange protein
MVLLLSSVAAFGSGTASPAPPPPPQVDLAGAPSGRGPDHNGKPHPVTARLLVEHEALVPGTTTRVGVHLTQQEGWHTYWKSPGDIGQPTEAKWSVPTGSVGELKFPVPQRFEQDGQISFGYDREVLLSADLSIPADAKPGPLQLAADINWLVCSTSCIPGSTHLELPLEIKAGGAPPSPTRYAPLFAHYAAQHPVPLSEGELPGDGPKVEYVLSASAVRPSESFRAAFVVTPPAKGAFEGVTKQPWPTFTPIASSYDWGVTGVTLSPQPDGKLFVVVDGETYEPDPLPQGQTVGGLLQLKVGDRWLRTEVSGPLPWAAAGAQVTPTTHPALAVKAEAPQTAPAGEVAHDGAADNVVPMAISPLGAAGTSGASLLGVLLFAFVGGLVLNVMPCVLPVLTLKLYGLVEQSDITPGRRRQVGLAYTGGVMASFLALALAVIVLRAVFGVQVDWGFQFQYPPYVAALATVVFAFGLSLLGVFEIPVIGAETAGQASSKEGLVGSFFTGVFATLLATPCSAPFLGTAIAYAFSAPVLELLAIFATVGLGLGAPFLLVAFVPALFRFLPRPGAWMDTFKQLLGFTLIATTIWLVDVLFAQIGGDRTVGFLAFLLAVGVGLWIFGHFGGIAESGRRQLAAAAGGAVVALGAGLYFLDLELAPDEQCDDGALVQDGLSFADGIPWQPFSEPRIEALAGKTVFVDFTAEWCLTCKVNERTVLETSDVRGAMQELGVVPLKADWTRRDEVITEWLRQNGRAGVPMYLVIPGDRTKAPILLPEVITPSMVVGALKQAG